MDGNGTIRSQLLLTLTVVMLLGGGVSSAPSSSPARIVNGLVSNAASALLKRISLLKVTTKTAIAGRPLMKFESGYVVETVFDGSKLGIDPHSVEVLPNGELLILDSANSNLYKMSSSLSLYSRPKLVAGSPEGNSGHVDGRPREARLNHPKGLTVDDKGNIYIADTVNMAIRKIGDSGVTTIAGGKSGKGGGHVDGPSEDAKFSDDFDVVYVGSSCSLLVIDRGNRAIREIQLHFDDCAYQYGSGFPLGFAVLLAAGFFGYMLAMLQHRVTAIVSSQNDHEVTKPSFSANPYQKPPKSSMRPPLIPTEDSEPEKQEEGFFGSLGKLFADAGSSGMEILGAMFPIFKRSSSSYEQVHQYHHHQQKQTNSWPLQESFVIPDEDEPPSIEARDTTPKKTYAFMSKDAEKMQQWRQSRAFYSNGGWEGGDYSHHQQQQMLYAQQKQQQQQNSQQKQQQQQKQLQSSQQKQLQSSQQKQQQQQQQLYAQQRQQQQQSSQQKQQHHHHRYHSSVPHTYYEENFEKTKEIVFGAVQEQKREAVVKPVDYGDLAYDHHNIRLRKGYSHGY